MRKNRSPSSKAEVLQLHGYVITIQKKMDIVANKCHKKVGPWQATFAGTRFVLHAADRDSLVEMVREKAKRLYEFEQLRQVMQRRRVGEARQELIDKKGKTRPGA